MTVQSGMNGAGMDLILRFLDFDYCQPPLKLTVFQ